MQASCHHRTALFIFLDVYLLFWCKLFTKLSKISRSFCCGSLSRSRSHSLSLVAIRMLTFSRSLSFSVVVVVNAVQFLHCSLLSLRDGDGGVVGFSLFCFLLCVLVWSRGFCFCFFFLHGLRKNLTNFKCCCCFSFFASFQKCVFVFLSVSNNWKSATPKCTQPKPSATLIVPKRFERPFWKSTIWQLKLCAHAQIPTVVAIKTKQNNFRTSIKTGGDLRPKSVGKAPTEGDRTHLNGYVFWG